MVFTKTINSSCALCRSGNRESTGHINNLKHRRALIRFFKLYNKNIINMPIECWDKIYNITLNDFIN